MQRLPKGKRHRRPEVDGYLGISARPAPIFKVASLLMPWHRNDSDPLEARRRQLEQQERLLSEQRKRLTEQLRESGEALGGDVKPAEPPVWRMEEDGRPQRVADPAPARRRNLGRQRQRDMILCFVFILFLIVVVIVLWVVYSHSTAAS